MVSLSWSSESRSVRSSSGWLPSPRLQLADGRADVRSYAIVHVAQDALSLAYGGLLACSLLEPPVGQRQFALAVGHLGAECVEQVAHLFAGGAKAADHDRQ
jgi:hypothetical protein